MKPAKGLVFLKKDKGSKTKIVKKKAIQLSRLTNGRTTALTQAPPLIKRAAKKIRAATATSAMSAPLSPLRKLFIFIEAEKNFLRSEMHLYAKLIDPRRCAP